MILILQHTVTSELDFVKNNMKKTLDAIKELNIQSILICGNADAGSKKISQITRNSKIKQYFTLSFEKYVNLLRNSSVLVGNSSSGIMEAPFLHIPSINIGSRQSRRLQAISVINVNYDKNEIKNDGFKITAKFQMYARQKGDTELEMVSALGKSIIHLSKFIRV